LERTFMTTCGSTVGGAAPEETRPMPRASTTTVRMAPSRGRFDPASK
jgi:hypothetical protein